MPHCPLSTQYLHARFRPTSSSLFVYRLVHALVKIRMRAKAGFDSQTESAFFDDIMDQKLCFTAVERTFTRLFNVMYLQLSGI